MHTNIYFLQLSAWHFPYATSYFPSQTLQNSKTSIYYSKGNSPLAHDTPLVTKSDDFHS